MALEILPQHWASFIAISIIIGGFILARIRKWMMTFAIIFINISVFIITFLFRSQTIAGFTGGVLKYAGLGFRPIYLSLEYSPQLYTLFTSMFIHSGFLHIFGNMLIFFFIGMAFEKRIGWKKFLIIYLLTGVCGALSHSLLNLEPTSAAWAPLVGASGAIFGIMGAFAFSYPNDEVVMPIPLGIIMVFRRIKVIYAVLIFAVIETVIVLIGTQQDNTAHFAHLGGFIAGLIIAALILDKRGKSSSTQTIQYDAFQSPKMRKIKFSNLKELADTPELQGMLEKIEKETVPQVRDAWIEHFLEKAKCPKCGHTLNHFNSKIWCENCSFKTKY